MKKLFGFMLLIAFCAIMSPVVTANNPPGQTTNYSFYIKYQNLPVAVDPAVVLQQDCYVMCAIIQPVEVNSISQNYTMDPEVQSRSGVITTDISFYTLSTTVNEQIIYNFIAGITYMEMGYSIWS